MERTMMKNVLLVIAMIAVICVVIYGGYYLAKNASYWLFYEDMVKETVQEMVKQEALK